MVPARERHSFGKLPQSLELVLRARKRLEYLRVSMDVLDGAMETREPCLGGAARRKHAVVEPVGH